MTLVSIDETSFDVLRAAFSEACARHGIAEEGDDGIDLWTIPKHAFGKGITSKDALTKLVANLVGN